MKNHLMLELKASPTEIALIIDYLNQDSRLRIVRRKNNEAAIYCHPARAMMLRDSLAAKLTSQFKVDIKLARLLITGRELTLAVLALVLCWIAFQWHLNEISDAFMGLHR